jgi:hypothetical protein
VAQAYPHRRSRRPRFTGPGSPIRATATHIRSIILPLVDQITSRLGLPSVGYELSVTNVNAASASDLGIRISGYSADVPVFLAMLSAALQIPVPQNIVTTGHIASTDRDIAAVKALPQKIAAATAENSVTRFLYPDLDRDGSIAALSLAEAAAAAEAIDQAHDKLRMRAVRDIVQLVETAFSDEAIVLASLQRGFFDVAALPSMDAGAVAKAIRFLAGGNADRFWMVLERYLLAADGDSAQRLLAARVESQLRRQHYPADLGMRLLQLLRSLPRVICRTQIKFPLVPMTPCLQLAGLAGEAQHEDVQHLLDAMAGRVGGRVVSSDSQAGSVAAAPESPGHATLDAIISQIDAAALAEQIGLPIDTARSTYSLDAVTTDSHEQFADTIASFYLHLLRHTRAGPVCGGFRRSGGTTT